MATATLTKPSGTHVRPDGRITWAPKDVDYIHKTVRRGVKEGKSIQSICNKIAESWEAAIPGITGRAVNARFYLRDSQLDDGQRVADTTRSRRAVQSAATRLQKHAKNGSPTRRRRQAPQAASAPTPVAEMQAAELRPVDPVKAVQQLVEQLQAEVAARKDAEKRAEKAEKRLARISELTAA